MTAQEHLEKIYEALSSIIECWPDPDKEFERENDESELPNWDIGRMVV